MSKSKTPSEKYGYICNFNKYICIIASMWFWRGELKIRCAIWTLSIQGHWECHKDHTSTQQNPPQIIRYLIYTIFLWHFGFDLVVMYLEVRKWKDKFCLYEGHYIYYKKLGVYIYINIKLLIHINICVYTLQKNTCYTGRRVLTITWNYL